MEKGPSNSLLCCTLFHPTPATPIHTSAPTSWYSYQALRSGAIGRPYTIAIPGNWREERVANIKNGNYCQPKCGEPFTESIFVSDEDGRLEILNVPMFKVRENYSLDV